MYESRYFTQPSFWLATTFVIIVIVFAVVLAGAMPSDKGSFVQYLVLTLELAIVSGICVGFLQSRLSPPSFWAKARWLGVSVLSTTLGWSIVFVLEFLLIKWLQSSPIDISDQLAVAAFYGFVDGALIGAVIGLVTSTIQVLSYHLPARQWIMGNLISWSIGIGIPLAVFYAGISQDKMVLTASSSRVSNLPKLSISSPMHPPHGRFPLSLKWW
ncbi:MAG: hypothetical protein QM730_09435 [Anaerolineales bacterium]